MNLKNNLKSLLRVKGIYLQGFPRIAHSKKSYMDLNIELLGYAGKTHLFKKVINSNFTLIKPNLNLSLRHELNGLISNLIQEYIIYVGESGVKTKLIPFIFKTLVALDFKGILRLFDEGLIKQNLNFFLHIAETKPDLFDKFMNYHLIIFVLPPIDVSYNRYIKRERLIFNKSRFYDNLKYKYGQMNEFIHILKNKNVRMLLLHGLDEKSDLNEANIFIESLNNFQEEDCH